MNDNDIKKGIMILLIIIVSVVAIVAFSGKKVIKKESPYKDVETEGNYGEIKEDEVEEFKGAGDADGDQIIDKNRITYLRKDIPILNTSMLIPQGWIIKERDNNILMHPEEDSELSKVQVAMYISDSEGVRDPNRLSDFFDKYKKEGFFYHNDKYKLKASNIDVVKTETIYDKNKKVYMHKGRVDEFEQLPDIPKGLNKEDFELVDRFSGVLEDTVIKLQDTSNYAVSAEVFNKFFYTLTGNNKSVIISFTTPKNFKEEMDEISRVMLSSIQDNIYVPANKSDAKAVSEKKEVANFSFLVPDNFTDEIETGTSYHGKAYSSLWDKSYGIESFVKFVDMPDVNFERVDLLDPTIRKFIEDEVVDFLYKDDRTIHLEEPKPVFDIITTNQDMKLYDDKESIEYSFNITPNYEVFKYNKARKRVPINLITTFIPYDGGYIFSITTYENSNYELARVYNNSILRSLKLNKIQ